MEQAQKSQSPDGSAATWIEVRPLQSRVDAFLWRAWIGAIPTLLLWWYEADAWTAGRSNQPGSLAPVFAAVPLAIGVFFGWRAFNRTHQRRFGTAYITYTQRQRLGRAARWWIPTAVITALICAIAGADGHFEQHWWWALPMIFPALVGLGLYRLRGEQAISSQAAAEMGRAEAEEAAQKRREVDAARQSESEALQKPWARFTMSAVLVIVALVWGLSASAPKSPAPLLLLWGAAILISLDLILLFAIVGGLAWLVIAGLSALPVSAAVIIGALIIANSSKS